MTPENKSLRGASLPASCGRSPAGRRSSAAFLRALLLAVRAAGDLESSPEYRKREKKENILGGMLFRFLHLGSGGSIQNTGIFQGTWETRGEFCLVVVVVFFFFFCPSKTPLD